MDNKNLQDAAEIDKLKREIFKRDVIIKDKIEQLRRIYCSEGWRLLVIVVNIKNHVCAYIRKIKRFLILFVLFWVTFLYTVYLFFLKKLRKITVFPGG